MRNLRQKIPQLFKEPIIYLIAAVLLIPAVFFVKATPNHQKPVDSPVITRQDDSNGDGEGDPKASLEETIPGSKKPLKKVETIKSTEANSGPTSINQTNCNQISKNLAIRIRDKALSREADYHEQV